MVKLATICYVDNGKEWLMLHRNKKVNDVHAGKWIGVGGKLEPGETPEDCAIREVKEETGLTVKKLELKGIITFPEFTPDNDWYTYVFKVTDFEGDLIDCQEGTLEWVPYAEINLALSITDWLNRAGFSMPLSDCKPAGHSRA